MLLKIILVTSKTNIRYFSGFTGTSGYLVLFDKRGCPATTRPGGFLFVDGRYAAEAKAVIPKNYKIIDTTKGFEETWQKFLKKYRIKSIGVEDNNITLRQWKYFKGISKRAKLVDIDNELDKCRMIKKTHELKYIKHAQKITERVFEALKKWLKTGLSEKQIAWKIEEFTHEFGADGMAFSPIVAINEHSARPHHKNSNRKLHKGDMLLIDMGAKFRGYCSDMTRVLFTKSPTKEQEKIYDLVKKAQETAIAKLKAGLTGKRADALARGVIEKAEYGKYFLHASGHGVGLDIHELPNLSQKYTEKIPAGCIVTVEPGIYLSGKFGVRIEDMVLVGKNGVQDLTKSLKSIQNAIIRLK